MFKFNDSVTKLSTNFFKTQIKHAANNRYALYKSSVWADHFKLLVCNLKYR